MVERQAHLAALKLGDSLLESARRTLLEGGHLTQEQGVRLFDAPLLELGRLANAVARDRHGDRVFFTVNRQLNPTNVCVLACKFCDYAKKPGAAGAYTMTRERDRARTSIPTSREIHIVGGLHNKWRFDDYLNIIRWVKADEAGPEREGLHRGRDRLLLPAHASSPPSGCSSELRAAGLDALPGGGAEVFSERVRREIFPPEDRRASAGSRSTRSRTGSASRPTPRCSTATSRRAPSACST